MASKRGAAVTAVILGAVAAASFLVWVVPDTATPEMTVSVSDFGNHLEGVRNIHGVLGAELDASFGMMLEGGITPERYVGMAEATSTQINALIIGLVESGAPEEWHESYIGYIDALKVQNEIIRETMVAADAAREAGADGDEGGGQAALERSLSRIAELEIRMESAVRGSAEGAP